MVGLLLIYKTVNESHMTYTTKNQPATYRRRTAQTFWIRWSQMTSCTS